MRKNWRKGWVYLDTNVFIYAMVYHEQIEEARLAKEVLRRIARGELEACTSSLTWDELVWAAWRLGGPEVARQKGADFLQFPNLKILSIDEGVLSLAQRIVESYDTRPRDAIHVACALKSGIKEIVSEDRELDEIREIRRIPLREALQG
jgi:predicted nucleic acid-binding protein